MGRGPNARVGLQRKFSKTEDESYDIVEVPIQDNYVNARGKWHFLVNIQHQHTVRQYILQHIIPNLERNGLPSINGIAAGVAGSLLGTTTVGNYSEVINRNLSSKAIDFYQDSLNVNTLRKRNT